MRYFLIVANADLWWFHSGVADSVGLVSVVTAQMLHFGCSSQRVLVAAMRPPHRLGDSLLHAGGLLPIAGP